MKRFLVCIALVLVASGSKAYTHRDTLRGSNGPGRNWWDVQRYRLEINFDQARKEINGYCFIYYKVIRKGCDSMQIDLQDGMYLDGSYPREGSHYWVSSANSGAAVSHKIGKSGVLQLHFHGKPRAASNAPWDGGFVRTIDSNGSPWMAVACQGLGASAWWPCKDYQGDEPDSGVSISITAGLHPIGANRSSFEPVICNGKFTGMKPVHASTPDSAVKAYTYEWTVRNPINTYDVTYYIGDYTHWHDTLQGANGVLDLDFHPLRYNESKARKQWKQAKDMLRCFEYWFGPYPFYEDGYKLVESPYLGMEHQSAIAYGNNYQNGYNVRQVDEDGNIGDPVHLDPSGSGVGFFFDYVIIHESAHEWFGNSITAQDPADNWIHEGFATYAEVLYAEWIRGKEAGRTYAEGQWRGIENDKAIIGDYGVNKEGSGDRYNKGAAVVHMIRMMLDDDERFRQLLHGLNKEFYHKIVTSKEVEDYISSFVGRDLSGFFDVYLRSTVKPKLVWRKESSSTLSFSWENPSKNAKPNYLRRLDGFFAPVSTSLDGIYYRIENISNGGVTHSDRKVGRTVLKPVGLYDIEEVDRDD